MKTIPLRLVSGESGAQQAAAEHRRLGRPSLFYLPLHALEVENGIRDGSWMGSQRLLGGAARSGTGARPGRARVGRRDLRALPMDRGHSPRAGGLADGRSVGARKRLVCGCSTYEREHSTEKGTNDKPSVISIDSIKVFLILDPSVGELKPSECVRQARSMKRQSRNQRE